MRLNREAHGFYIKPKTGSGDFQLIGKRIESMSVAMNGSFETAKDITGETSVTDTGYNPNVSVDPYYADPSDSIYTFLKDLAMNRKSGDAAAVVALEVLVEDTSSSSHSAWQENAIVEIVSYGGDTSGLGISYNVHFNGGREEGTVTFDASKKPTFTKGGKL